MNIPFLDLKRQLQEIPIKQLLLEKTINNNQFIEGEEVRKFEKQFAELIGKAFCISCANGTDALEMALEVVGVGEGDEIIIPAFGWVSTYTSVKRAGAKPVLVDVDPITGNLSIEEVKKKIGKKTKVVIPIHLYGNPCEINQLKSICKEHDTLLIEDCAQAHGASIEGQMVGSFGDLAIFSFYPTKNLGALGDAGAILTNRKDWNEKLRSLKNYGRESRHQFQGIGRNSRMDELQAAILNLKLKYLQLWNSRRREIASKYFEALSNPNTEKWSNSVFYVFPIRIEDREKFRDQWNASGIGTDVHYPFTIANAFNEDGMFPESDRFANQVISIPIYPQLTEKEISYICEHLKKSEKLLI